jgi:hypothetical protein
VARQIGDLKCEATALGNMGVAHSTLGEKDMAITLHQEQLTLALDLGDQGTQAQAFGNLGRNYLARTDYEQAFECHERISK